MIPASLKAWYERQSERDQRVLRWGGVIVVILVILGVLVPLQRGLVTARSHLAEQQADLVWMRSMAPALAAAGPGPAATPTNESLVVLIDRTARESGLAQALTGSQPSGNGAMRVQLENADFNLLIGWLSRLGSQLGVRVENASVTANGSAGVVNATILLQR
ncbi:MAG TPA: type II secretion system protein M [Steroidobacteraceae bacterium]|nr:type II secretion system protein M [Steroidobacteraceae bacterium]